MEKTTGNTLETLLQGDKTVFADFRASWCAPCRMLAPIFESLAEKYADKAVFVEIDVDEENATAEKYGVYSIPNVIAFKNGQVAANRLGFAPEEEMEAFIVENL